MNTIFTNLKYIAFGLVLALGISYASAEWGIPNGTHTAPATFPSDSTPTPLTVGSTAEVKTGGLALGGWFEALQNAQIEGQTIFSGVVRAGTAAIPTAGVTLGNSTTSTHAALTGGIATAQTLTISSFATGAVVPVCTTTTGTLVLCPDPDVCTNIDGPQEIVPSGYVRNSDGTCTVPPPDPVATLDFFVDGSMGATANYVRVSHDDSNTQYMVEMFPGADTGTSQQATVPPGTYSILESDAMCDAGRFVTYSPEGQFIILENDHFTMTFICH